MNYNDEALQILEQTGAIATNDHFVYTSGKHGSVYIRKDRLYPHTLLTSKVCEMIAEQTKVWDVDVVVGPSVGGIILSQWTAYHLSKIGKHEVLSVFTEKSYGDKDVIDGTQLFKRGYDQLVKGQKVLVVEDLTTTGMSVKRVVDEVKKAEGEVVGVFVLLNRNPRDVNETFMQAPFHSLSVYAAEAYDPQDCPLCKKGIPVNTEVGHGKEFLKKQITNQ